MNGIVSMLQNREKNSRDVVATTIRISAEMSAQIEGLVDYLNVSRNEVIVNLLKTGLEKANEVINRTDPGMFEAQETQDLQESQQGQKPHEQDTARNFFLVNTNKGNNVDDHSRMLKEGCVEIFSAPWMHLVDRIRKDDVVFLYANGEGIVAYGRGSGHTLQGNRYEDVNNEESRYQKLDRFVVLKKPVKASDIHRILGKRIPFLRTLTLLKEGKKLLDALHQ